MACFQPELHGANSLRTHIESTSESPENGGATLYQIRVWVSPECASGVSSPGSATWTVSRRYRNFATMHASLVQSHALPRELLPPKKMIGNRSARFVAKRREQLDSYLSQVVSLLCLAPLLPPVLARFLHMHHYEALFLLRDMAASLFDSPPDGTPELSPLQLFAISERVKLAAPPLDSADGRCDFAHVLDFASNVASVHIVGSNMLVGTSNLVPNTLPFDLSAFKSLRRLKFSNARPSMVTSADSPRRTVVDLVATDCQLTMLSEVLACDATHRDDVRHAWTHVESADFSRNELSHVDASITLLPLLRTLCLSNNKLCEIPAVTLPSLRRLDLSSNLIATAENVHTRLGNVTHLHLSQNHLSDLSGLSRLYSLVHLDLSCNKVEGIEEARHLSRLPCLDSLLLTGNPVATCVDYRVRVLHALAARAAELALDNEKASQKELDTVAVLQALDKAKERVT